MSDVVLPAEPAFENPSLTDRFSEWGDKVSDRVNPILVKETRQALKSRQFSITFMLLLVVAWLISAGGALWAGPAIEFGSAGREFFILYYWVLSFAIFLVVPFGSFRSMLNERDHNTYELLSISTLTPGQIVRGKLSSSIVQILIFYSAIAPFIAFTSLLQGFDLPLVSFMLVVHSSGRQPPA
jgi:ABC-type Na+ efflux pump permease subunit